MGEFINLWEFYVMDVKVTFVNQKQQMSLVRTRL